MRISLLFCPPAVLLAGCSLGDAQVRTGEEGPLVIDGEGIWNTDDSARETPAELEISAQCRDLSQADQEALTELRLR